MTRLNEILPDFPVTKDIPPFFKGNLCQILILSVLLLYKVQGQGYPCHRGIKQKQIGNTGLILATTQLAAHLSLDLGSSLVV